MKRCSHCWWFSKALLSSLYILLLPFFAVTLGGFAEHLLCCFQPSSSFQTNYAARMQYACPGLYKHCWWAHFAFSKGSRLAGVVDVFEVKRVHKKRGIFNQQFLNQFVEAGKVLCSC